MARHRSKTVRRRRYRGGEGEGAPAGAEEPGFFGKILALPGKAVAAVKAKLAPPPATEATNAPAESGDGVPAGESTRVGGRKSRKSRRTRRRHSRR